MAIPVGSEAPAVVGVGLAGPHALVFYKVTCSVTQMAGPPLARLGDAYPGAVVGVGQDPPEDLDTFAATYAWRFPQVPDLAPYSASDAYGIASAPTVVVIDGDGRVADVVESWDRDGVNRASSTLAGLLHAEPKIVSEPDDGLPAFKPG
jgi:AhpC/TSA family